MILVQTQASTIIRLYLEILALTDGGEQWGLTPFSPTADNSWGKLHQTLHLCSYVNAVHSYRWHCLLRSVSKRHLRLRATHYYIYHCKV